MVSYGLQTICNASAYETKPHLVYGISVLENLPQSKMHPTLYYFLRDIVSASAWKPVGLGGGWDWVVDGWLDWEWMDYRICSSYVKPLLPAAGHQR